VLRRSRRLLGALLVNDPLLVARAQQGDQAAAAALVRRYRRRAHAIASMYYIVGADRDDVEAEALLGLAKAIRDYRADRSYFAVLCMERQVQAAVKRALSGKHVPLNSAVRHAASEDGGPMDVLELLEDFHGDPVDVLAARDEFVSLLAAIGRDLSPLQREVVVGFVSGLSYAEIGGPTDKEKKRVDNAFRLAREKLRRAA
jgi:RNA polymerase sporulation-specific sigma factor